MHAAALCSAAPGALTALGTVAPAPLLTPHVPPEPHPLRAPGALLVTEKLKQRQGILQVLTSDSLKTQGV